MVHMVFIIVNGLFILQAWSILKGRVPGIFRPVVGAMQRVRKHIPEESSGLALASLRSMKE